MTIRFNLEMSRNQLWEIIHCAARLSLREQQEQPDVLLIICNCVTQSINELKPQVDDLSRSSNTVFRYVTGMSNSLRERQRVSNGEKEKCKFTTITNFTS